MKANKNLIIALVLFAVIFISYANIFQNEFVLDDKGFIVENIRTKDFKNIPKFFVEPSTGNLYRPLRTVFYTLHYRIWGTNTFGYHLNSIILHTFVTILLFFITLKMTKKFAFSFVAALFFAAHPIHTARVTNMTAAFDIYGIFFILLSFYCYILASSKTASGKKYYCFLSILFYVLALFSSEEAITLILILLLYDLSFNYKASFNALKLLFKRYLPYIIISIFYLIVRLIVLQQVGRAEAYFKESFLITQLTTIKAFANYVLLLFFPYNITIFKNYSSVASALNPAFLVSLFALSAIIFFAAKSYAKSKIIFFSIGFFFITLLPFSNMFPQLTLMADRYLYLPSYGFCIFLALTIFNLKGIKIFEKHSKIIIPGLIIAILGFYIFLAIQINAEWRSQFTVLNAAIEKNKGKGTMAHAALAEYYTEIKDYNNAIKYSESAIQLLPDNFYAYKNLGRIYAELGNYSLAIDYYEKSLEIKPGLYESYNSLGLIYSYVNDFDRAVFYIDKAIEIDPGLAKAHNDIGTVYAKIGKFDLAIAEINKAIKINPYQADYYYNLAVIYEFLEDNAEAKSLLLKALELEPNNKNIKNKLGKLKQG